MSDHLRPPRRNESQPNAHVPHTAPHDAHTAPATSPPLDAAGHHFADISVTATPPAVQRQPSLPVQRDGFQLSPPTLLQPPDPAARYHLGGDLQLQLDPQIEAMMQQQLHPDIVLPSLARINLNVPAAGAATPPADPTSSAATAPTPPAAPAAPPAAPPATPSADAQDAKPKNASAGDVFKAVVAMPEVKIAWENLQTLAITQVKNDWSKLKTGEKIGVISTVSVIALGSLAGAATDPDARKLVFDQLNGKTIPVPGLSWLAVETNISGPNLMFGLHLDVGKFLPASLNFGPASFGALGGPPQPEPLPGQRRAADDATPSTDALIGERIRASAGRGAALKPATQQWLEGGLGANLAQVRLHTDSEADHLSRSLGATAFTTGADIFFRSGAYSPGTSDGQRLLAHEATHTVQQASGPVAGTPTASGVAVSDPSDRYEQAAEQSADALVQQMPEPLNHTTSGANTSNDVFTLETDDDAKQSMNTPTAMTHVDQGNAGGLQVRRSIDNSDSQRESPAIQVFDDAASHMTARQIGAHAFSRQGNIFLGDTLGLPGAPTRDEALRHERTHALQARNTGSIASESALEAEAHDPAVEQPALSADPQSVLGLWWVIPLAVGAYILLRPKVANAPGPNDHPVASPSDAQIVGESLALFAVPGGVTTGLARMGFGVVGAFAISGAVGATSYRGVQDVGQGQFSGVEAYVVDATTGAVIGVVVGGVFQGFGGTLAAAPRSNPSLIHLTDQAGEAGINASGTLRGSQGIYALPANAANEGTAMRVARTFLRPSQTSQVVPISEAGGAPFSQPLPVGPVSAYQRMMGVYRAPAGIIDLGTGAFTPSGNALANVTGQFWPYGVDALLWAGGATIASAASPASSDAASRGLFTPMVPPAPLSTLIGSRPPLPETQRDDGPFIFVTPAADAGAAQSSDAGSGGVCIAPDAASTSTASSPNAQQSIDPSQQSAQNANKPPIPAVIVVAPLPQPSIDDAGASTSTDASTPNIQRKAISQAVPQVDRHTGTHVGRKAEYANDATVTPNAQTVVDGLQGGGQLLDKSTRALMEPHFGHSFANVRVHTDNQAVHAARVLHAEAFTVGNNIAFGAGQYQLETESGQRLLAHELTHVVQQASGPVAGKPTASGVAVSDPSDSYEQAAEHNAQRLVAGDTTPVQRSALTTPRGAATLAVQRKEEPASAGMTSPDAPMSVPAPNPTSVATTITYKGKTLSADSAQLRELLNQIVVKDGFAAAQAFARDVSGMSSSDPQFAGTPPALIETIRKVIDQQLAALEKYRSDYITRFEDAAKVKTMSILKESEDRIKAEQERYGVTIKSVNAYADWFPFQAKVPEYGMANNADTQGLAAAAAELVPKRRELEALSKKRTSLEHSMPMSDSPGAAIGHTPIYIEPEHQAEYDQLGQQIVDARNVVNAIRSTKESMFPLLSTYGPEGEENTNGLERISKGGDSAKNDVASTIAEKLQNIQKVRDGLGQGQVKIWKNQTILSGTKAELGASPTTVESKLVDEHASEIASDELYTNLLVGAVAIGLGLIAAIPTGGLSVAGAAAVTGAAAVSAGLSTYQAAKSLQEYQFAQAEKGTDFDKAKAISQEDPSLGWLALDIVAAGLDLKGAVTAFRTLAPVVRRAVAARTAIKEIEALGKAAEATEDAKKELEALKKTIQEINPKVAEKALAHIGDAVDASKDSIAALEKTAREQYKALADAGRLEEIGNISEDMFVKQLASGAKSHVIVAGQAGILRTQTITELMKPGNPRIAAVLGGDVKAMDQLLIEHGNWKQLMSMLEQGTPEMRQASQKFLARRGDVEKDVAEFLKRRHPTNASESVPGVQKASGASTEAVSDVDFATLGNDAGEKMIQAEEFVKGKYGAGWSEVLRMNFYTDAGRLTMYENVMKYLDPAGRAAMLGDMSKQAEKLNIAKMLNHAGGDPKRVAEVEAYAQKIGVDIKDAAIQELLQKLGSSTAEAERNKLLLEVDGLVKRYEAAEKGSKEQIELAKQISTKQMEANALTTEAYIGPGAGRMTVSGIKVVGQEAYQAALSNLEMIQHVLHETAGNAVLASREYELYKYINRFAEAAESAGAKTPGLDYWKNFSGFAYKTERQATSEVAHMAPRPGATISSKGAPVLSDLDPTIGEVSDQFLKNQIESWNSFSQQALGDVKKLADEKPGAWAAGNMPRPAAGAQP